MAKTQIKNYVFKPGIGALDNYFPNAYSLISSNKEFIKKEATAWIQTQVDADAPGFVGYTYNKEKCERDVGYVVDAYLHDLRYGGNEKLYNTIKYYWDQDVAQVDGDRQPEIQTHTFIGNLIKDNILTNIEYAADNTEVSQTIDETLEITDSSFTPTDASYNPRTGVMTLTIDNHGLAKHSEIFIAPGAIIFTCSLDGNATEHPYPRATGVPNAKGRDPFYYAPLKITATTTDTITVNVGISSDTSTHTFVRATTDGVTSGPTTKINTLAFNTVDVITNGLLSLPEFVQKGVGSLKIQGQVDLDEFLLITNVTANEVIFNFAANATGGSVDIKRDKIEVDPDFPKYLQTTDGITTLTLNYSTLNHDPDDEIQIFVEFTENGRSVVTTRPFDFGTDAIERMRVAQPLSMLDADFEYGLQPTKWAAISTLRGYPSVYEIPGTDTPVSTVVTDASAGTDGIGQSLITVTTIGAHGLAIGDPVTVKALEDSVIGAARAEGSFVVVNVPDDVSFQYYAKSKVGTAEGTTLSTTYTQLRKAGFYTGAEIGGAIFAVESQGSAGTLTLELDVEAGATIIPYDGITPEIGAPILNNGKFPVGTQITGVITTSSGGGVYITPTVTEDIQVGDTEVQVQTSAGVVTSLAADRGDGLAAFVNNINPFSIEFNEQFTSSLGANLKTYTGVAGNNEAPGGIGATFDISVSGTSYVLDAINLPGAGYEIGDRINIEGDAIGGITPDNDATIIVTSTFSDGAIDAADIEGTAFNGTGTASGVPGTYDYGVGITANFNVTWEDNVYQTVDISSPDTSEDYKVGDIIVLAGTDLDSEYGASPGNDLYVTVTGIGAGGSITSVSFEGTAPDSIRPYNNLPYTTSGAGIDAIFDVTAEAGAYQVVVTDGGQDFLPTDTVTILGTDLGGASPLNDLTITIDNVDGTGAISTVSVSGIAFNGGEETFVFGTNRLGQDATFNVEIAAGAYTVTIANGGTLYGAGQEIVIPGTSLFGSSPANDLTVTIDTVDDITTGEITAVSGTGTASAGSTGATNIEGQNENPNGVNAFFDVNKNFDIYDIISINDGGTGYKVGNRINLPGTLFSGVSPLNDITIRVTAIDSGTGEILNFISSYEEAEYGINLDLYSTVSISEAVTSQVNKGETADFEELATLTIDFPNAHGLVPGSSFIVSTTSDDGSNNHALAAGSFIATDIPTKNSLRFQARAAGPIDTLVDDIQGVVYPRPDSFFIHRPYDGGVQLGTGGPQHGAQAIRQSKKYIRYQSGKGIMYTTGALFAPSYDLRSVTAEDVEVGSEITVVTDDNDHGVQVGGIVRLLGIETPGYNSGPETAVPPQFDYEVIDIIDERTFKIRAQRRLGSTTAVLGFAAQMSVVAWHGATVRSGIFDDQNGIFWEFDGTQISVVQRTGTKQIAGTIELTVDDNQVTGINTRFLDQLKAGDRIIVKGMTHVVSHVNSQTDMTVTPDWRGVVGITGAKANLIVDKKVKQTEFNLDSLNGTGPSGYNLDVAKMQMIGIQYSWYGAGFIDFMLRGADGNFVYAHRMRNSNVNTEAFMRSGNLPVRYEVTNEGPPGKLTEAMDPSQTYMELEDTSFFPTSGYVYIDNEVIQFTGKDDSRNRLTNLTRGATFQNFQAGADRNYTAGPAASHNNRTGVILISSTITPLISHWGSAFITDGLFDDDRGYIFSYTESGLTVTTTRQTAFMIRLAPSVSNALVGDLGERELLNRAQLLLQGIEITSDAEDGTGNLIQGGIVVEGILNPQNYPVDPSSVGWQELSGLAQGGQPSFAQIASGGAIDWTTDDTATTSTATAQANMNATVGIRYSRSNRNFMYPRRDQWEASNARVGDFVTASSGGATFGGGRRITEVRGPYSSGNNAYYFVRLESNYSGTTSGNVTIQRRSTFDNRNFAYIAVASLNASGAKVGTSVTSGGSVGFPAGTQVSNVEEEQFGDTTYFVVSFNNSFSGSLVQGSGTIEFEFRQPPFGQPGETVFSFIAVPGERSELDLSALKELTNTPLGGRGTYPNGPDVLALNVYKVSGADTDANIVLKWGEAQA